jgi:antitoxin component YwqK of YwqJK toxin-antitoxin module/Tfp pilus assembly protein PilF
MKKGIIVSLYLCFSLITLQIYGQENIYLSSDQFVNEGIEFHNKGEYEQAITNYKKVSKCDPNYALACYELALTYYYIDNYEAAMAKCNEALSLNYDKAFVYSLMGSIFDEMGKENEGIELLTGALRKWPYNQNLLLNLAICYLNTDQPILAEYILKKSILINPYHARTHLCLAKVNYMMGRITQSYLAYNMVLLLNPSINNIAAFEEAISQKPKLKYQEYKYPYSKNINSEKWDEIKGLLQSELAFSKDFEYDYENNYMAGRQSLMLFRKLTFEPSDTSIYSRLYSRLFVEINQKVGFETYLNYILKNTNNDNVVNWTKKNKDKLDSFVNWAQSVLNEGRLYGFSYQDEQNSKKTYHYDEQGNLVSIGELSGVNGSIKNGTWLIIGDDGYISEKGVYLNNKAEGEWLIYWPDGTIKNHLNFVNDELEGINKEFYPNGTISRNYNSKSGKKDGIFESYSHSGFITNKINYSEDLANGPGVYNDYNGGFKREYNYNKGTLEKENIETWLNGNDKQRCSYHNGMLNGTYTTWYSNSRKEAERIYKNDSLVGKYYEYYPNNQKSREYEYSEKEHIIGKVITYDRTGNITSIESEYKDGILTGTRIDFFPDGKNQKILSYLNDHLTEILCFDDKGNQLYNAKNTDSIIYLKSFYADGILSSEGLLVNDVRHGNWKFYNPLGIITTESNYSNGMFEGVQHTYNANGQVEKEYSCVGNNIIGLYKEYYINGHLKMQGNYDSSGVAGKWLYYYNNDTLSNIIFYKNGKIAGRSYAINPSGQLKSEEFYDNEGKSIRYKEYEADGSVVADMNYKYGSHTFETKFPNGKLKEKKNFADNLLHGLHENYYPNGQLATQTEYSHNSINKLYKKWDYQGNVTYEMPYIFGLAEGEGKWYRDNNLEYVAHYEQDKLQDKTTSYYYNGQKARESMYVDDKRNGNSDYFSPEGILMYRIGYIDNSMKTYSYLDKSGNMIPEIPITDTTSKIITQYANGKVSAIISLSKGLYHGKYISYYSTGSVLREEMNKYGENEGYIKTYYPNNRLRELINYSSNNRQGLYELYFESGKKQKSGNYYMDIEDGDWKIYNTDGNIKEILTYRNGIIYDIKKR